MADAITPAPATEPDIKDDLPANAEVVAEDDAQITQLLARFGMAPELTEAPAVVAGEKVGEGEREKQVAEPASISEVAPAPAHHVTPAPASFTPEQETLITQRLEAKAKEFEPLTAERDAALAQAEELQSKLQAITQPAPVPREIDPLLLEDDFNAIDKQERNAEKLLAWCDEHEDAGFTPREEGEKSWTPAEIRKLRRGVEKQINVTLPEARHLVQTRAAKRAEARQSYPALFDPKSEEFKIRQGFYAKAPWIKAVFPQFDLWLGDMIAGERSRRGRSAAPGASVAAAAPPSPPKAPTPPVLPTPGGAPMPTGGAKPKARGIDTEEFIKRGGSRNALVDLIKISGL